MKENTEPNPQPAIKQASSAQVWEVEKCSLQPCVCESEGVCERKWTDKCGCVLKRVCVTGMLLTCGCMLLILWSGCQEDRGASVRSLIDCPTHNKTQRPHSIYIQQGCQNPKPVSHDSDILSKNRWNPDTYRRRVTYLFQHYFTPFSIISSVL